VPEPKIFAFARPGLARPESRGLLRCSLGRVALVAALAVVGTRATPAAARATPAAARATPATPAAARAAPAAARATPATARPASATKTLAYHGYRLVVPVSWPVYRLQTQPTACVRFNRHAVYLGRPGGDQRCDAHAAGRTEAILVQPVQVRTRGGDGQAFEQVLAAPSAGDAGSAQILDSARGVVVTATWSRDPTIIQRALGLRSPSALTAAQRHQLLPASPTTAIAASAAATSNAHAASDPASVYTGLGFDTCTTPSDSQMTAWSSSPYHAVGIYIGGANLACSQPNLTSSWVSQQSAAGWHLIPIYVGLQAPSSDCSCASISPDSAASEGGAAAANAIADAQALGLGAGNPVYLDMEAYERGGADTATVLAFIASWTAHLHAGGYQSGVYVSAGSGILDLVSRYGASYLEPDDIWVADWNGAQRASDPSVPPGEWSSHQRLHQYDGAHNEAYGGVTLNIDGDYLNGATATAGTLTPEVDSAPALTVSPAANGVIDLYPSWSGAGGIGSWRVMAGATPAPLLPVADRLATRTGAPIAIDSAFRYFEVQALATGGQPLGSSPTVATPPHVAIFGRTVFVPRQGLAGLPVGCLTGAPCHLKTTISAAAGTLVTTSAETVGVGGGLIYFKLPATAHAALVRANHHRLAVQITVRDSSGRRASRPLTLVAFSTSGAGPHRSVNQSAALRIVGTSDFVANGWVGGILAACSASSRCQTTTTITAEGQVIARAGPQSVGVNELGYLLFTLTAAGHSLLAHARGNQLPARVMITDGGASAAAQIALSSYG